MRYILCVDGSPSSEKAIQVASGMINEGDHVLILHCYDKPLELLTTELDVIIPSAADQDYMEELERRKQKGQQIIALAMDSLRKYKPNLPTESSEVMLIECVDVKDTIVTLASEKQVDIIIVGTRGLGTIQRMLIGSVSSYVLHHSPCSVLVAR